MSLTEQEKTTIALMDERLKRLEDIYFSKGQETVQPTAKDEVNYVRCVDFNGCLKEIIVGKIYPLKKLTEDGAFIYLDEERYTFLHDSQFESSTIEDYQKQLLLAQLTATAENKYPVGTKLKNNGLCPSSSSSNGIIGCEKPRLEKDGLWIRASDGYHLNVWNKTKGWAEIEETKWKPRLFDVYYYIKENFTIHCTKYSHPSLDDPRINAGNCFKTFEQAQELVTKIKELLKD